jgi:hypothetical protein
VSKILKNNTASPISITDTGVTIPASPGSYTIPEQDYLLWAASANIATPVNAGNIIVNDGLVNLSATLGLAHLRDGIAKSITFDNSVNGFLSTQVQAAIEEAYQDSGGLKCYVAGALAVFYKSGYALFNGVLQTYAAGFIAVPANQTNCCIYAKSDGTVEAGTTPFLIPDNAVPMAIYSTNATVITALSEARSSLNNYILFGTLANTATIGTAIAKTAGVLARNARADHTHDVIIGRTRLASTTTITSSSTTFTTMTTMTSTPASGTYLVLMVCDASISDDDAGEIALAKAGTNIAETVETISVSAAGSGLLDPDPVATVRCSIVCIDVIQVNGSQLVEGRFRRSSSSGTLTVRNRVMILLKVDPT